MNGLRFAEPAWVHAFWVLAALVGLFFWLERRGDTALLRLVGSPLRARLVSEPAPWRRHARTALLMLCLAAVIVALMRPQWGLRYASASRASAEIMLCLDVSRSMLAEDAAPNRLERAKAEIVDLLSYLEGDRVGLIAFAGRATVLSPMTPDFGFLRLVLDTAGPRSVARGGTRLEEPIRKAIDGFDPRGGAARVIVLITDGEDLDSFPLRAAEAASEAGVRIIAIGYGSEEGSPVYITDPRTGARTQLRDPDGRPVESRLDGDTLREIVRETRGVYIPAGTGVLDLESIYAQHLSGLLRAESSGRGVPVREEGYQWALLLALLALLASSAVTGQTARDRGREGRVREAAVVGVLALALGTSGLGPARALAQGEPPPAFPEKPSSEAASPADAEASVRPDAESSVGPTGPASGDAESDTDERTPRTTYNQGLEALRVGDLETAERALRSSRSSGAQDPELRFRSTYNLGLARARRAEDVRESELESALALYYDAADRFRDAARQRPDDEDVRHNLEVVLQRALVLEDEIARRDAGSLEEKLRALLEQQRAVLGQLAPLLASRPSDAAYDTDPVVRRAFRAAGGEQRVLLSESDALARQVAVEREGIGPDDSDAAPRAAQLDVLRRHLDRARERMGQARSQMRRRQGERAYRRASSALNRLKRALDALRDPAQVLDGLLADGRSLTSPLSSWSEVESETTPGGSPSEGARRGLPGWITPAYLGEQEDALAERTDELASRLPEGAGTMPEPATSAGPAGAVPYLSAAAIAFRNARGAIDASEGARAVAAHARALRALLEARERFLGLKALIELLYRDERLIAQGLADADPVDRVDLQRTLQSRNLERAERLAAEIDREKARVAAAPEDASQPAEAREAAQKRLELAGPLLEQARERMRAADAELRRARPRLPRVQSAATEALQELTLLRRLFFTLTELLRDTAVRQAELNDDTREVAALLDPEALPDRTSPLVATQSELEELSGGIASALEEQAAQTDPRVEQEPAPEEASEILGQASEHVRAAEQAMQEALEGLDDVPAGFEKVDAGQTLALEELARALALLVPPEQQREPQSGEGDGESQPQEGKDDGSGTAEGQDPAQVLQAVRDREAQRRREARPPGGYETVERDW